MPVGGNPGGGRLNLDPRWPFWVAETQAAPAAAPDVVAPLAPPLQVHLAAQSRASRGAHAFRQPPVIAAATPSFLSAPLRTTLAIPSAVRTPALTPRSYRNARFTIPPPAVARRSSIATTRRAATPTNEFRPPLYILPFPFPPRRAWLVKPTGQKPAATSVFGGPVVVNAAPAALRVPTRVTLAARRFVSHAASWFTRPTVVATPAVFRPQPPRLTLAKAQFQPSTQSAIGGPLVVTALPLLGVEPLRVSLAAGRPLQLRRAQSTFRAPVVVGPFATPTLRNRTITVTLARRQWAVRPTSSRRGVTVTAAAPTTTPSTGVNQDFASIVSGW